MLAKSNKTNPIRLKFDTSSHNLACFIKTRNKLVLDNDNHDKHTRTTRRRPKSTKTKNNLKNQGFLESILINTFTEQFACTDEIKQLVNNLEISSDQEIFQQQKPYPQTQSDKFNTPPEEQDYKVIISGWVDSPKQQAAVSSTRVGTEQTPSHANLQDFSEFSFTEMSPPYQSLQFGHFYDQNYYMYQQYQGKQGSERKKRNVTHDQAYQYRIQPCKIEVDGRTTLMIRNIPNKYTQDLLLEEFNRNFKVKFDFFYLPIDYNNTCNVGYAFINFIHAKFILEFYNQFNNTRWNKFNSQKICSLTYARIQGTGALRNHFKNSHVMQQKDKRFRPLINTNEIGQEQRYSLSKIVQEQQEKR